MEAATGILAGFAIILAITVSSALPPTVQPQPVQPERWDELLREQSPHPEACPDCKRGTRPQPKTAGLVSRPMKLYGGDVAYYGQFPWQVALYPTNGSFCGGSLISDQWVLTAAHCFTLGTEPQFRVVVGSRTLGSVADTRRAIATATKVIVHPEFNSTALTNDIAVVQLEAPVVFNRFVNPIRLPSRSSFSTPYDGHQAKFSGWGLPENRDSLALVLRYSTVRVASNEDCARSFGEHIHSVHLCTSLSKGGKVPRGGCVGDSGNALVVKEQDNLQTQVGLLSFVSADGCTATFPTVFTRVTAFLNWIENSTDLALRP